MMRYRAQLLGVPELERPVQCFGNTLAEVESWAQLTLKQYPDSKYPQAQVAIHETKEIFLWSRRHFDYVNKP